jgi:biopolymer transport protein TolQ
MEVNADLMNPLVLFGQADIVVKSVIVLLLIASIWTWAIIVGHSWRLRREMRESDVFERELWEAKDIDAFHDRHAKSSIPGAKLFLAGIAEWRRSTGGKSIDREGTRSRLMGAMNASSAAEIDRLSDRLNILLPSDRWRRSWGCSVPCGGSCARSPASPCPTTPAWRWVAPGIAEALFATRWACSRHPGDRVQPADAPAEPFESRLGRLADRFHAR